jgi:3-oxoacyl-[acyl-carrier-protein] synthase II
VSAPGTSRRRVVVTGLGAVTPVGLDVRSTWSAIVGGRSGIRAITAFDPSRVACRIAGEVVNADPSRVLDRKAIRRTDRCTHLALLATQEALADAGLPERLEGELAESTGTIIGTGLGGSPTLFEEIITLVTRGPDRVSPFFIPMTIPNMPAGEVAIRFGAQGPSLATVSACASAGHAIGEAGEMILRGDAEVMLAGGAESPVVEGLLAGFGNMRALSTRNDDPAGASRPFDCARDGFVIAEGSATLVLEELGHAERRGARIYAELLGYASSADAYHVTQPAPGGAGAVRAGRRALVKAGSSPDEIDLISAHATSTPDGDAAELAGLLTLLGAHAPAVSITATKSSVGHTLGAAGAIASVVAITAMGEGVVPPTLNLVEPDPAGAGLDLTPLVARNRRADTTLVNAFGFGGQNTSLVLRRWGA